MAIYKKLAQIQSEIRGLTKDKGAFNYDYLTGDKLLGEIRPRMVQLGLLLMPEVTEVKTEPITYDSWNKQGKYVEQKTEVLATVKMTMTWVDTEDTETLTQQWAGTGMNAFDKGYGSALTYGERYYLLKLFHIPTDKDDVDAIAKDRDEAIANASGKKGPQKADKESVPTTTLNDAIKALYEAKNRKELNKVWKDNATYQNVPEFLKAAGEMAKKYPK